MIEAFYGAILKNSGIKYTQLKHGRYALSKSINKENYIVSVDFSLLSRYLDIMNLHNTAIPFPVFPYRSRALRDFKFKVEDRIKTEEGNIIKISYKPANETYIRCFSGFLYINSRTFDLVRIEAVSNNNDKPPFFIFNKKVELSKCNLYFDIRFKADSLGNIAMQNINMKINYDLMERGADKLRHHVETYSNLVIYEHTPTPRKTMRIPDEDYYTDYDRIKQRLYLKQFWDENPILAETPIETSIKEDFEKKGFFGRAFNNTNDTLQLLEDGYKLWSEKKKLTFNRILNSKPENIRLEKLEITQYGVPVGGLYSDLFFAWNCYKDSFYYCILPLFDLKASWASDSLRELNTYYRNEWIYQMYFDLLECSKREFKKVVSETPDKCEHAEEIEAQYREIAWGFDKQVRLFLNDVLGQTLVSVSSAEKEAELNEKFKFWDKKIKETLADSEAYK
jgi:hypothetical protein